MFASRKPAWQWGQVIVAVAIVKTPRSRENGSRNQGLLSRFD
jgi:hypothetical protein